MSESTDKRYDVVIIGGGMVGATLACALGESAVSVALVERGTVADARPDDRPELRVSAITQASRNVLAAVGAWGVIEGGRIAPFTGMSVWDANGSGRIGFDCADIGARELGWIIENRVIQHALLKRALQLPNIDVFCAHGLAGAEWREHEVEVNLEDGTRLCTSLLVGADGARSQVRELADIGVFGWSYEQTGVVATITSTVPHAGIARQRFLSTGPLAFLPLYDGQCSIVWSTSPAEAERLIALAEPEFESELEEAFEHELGALHLTSERAGFPLRLQHAQRYVQDGVALIGDAAHTIHPLAGQGVNLGILDAAALAEVLLNARARGRNLGSRKVLRRYERWRKGHNLLVQGVMDGFKRFFGSRFPLLPAIRNLGMGMTDASRALKDRIMRRAMGLDGDLPASARSCTPLRE